MPSLRLQQALSRHYGTAVVLDLNHESVQPVEDTPARRAAQEAEERLVRARARLDDDPTVRALKERFGASVPPDSVKPVR
jgi:DNA polymerase-3 subunit gamma/tau